ncbi:BTB/POZ protein [Geranomyces variabilis]|nr:BTB/POZ protein [Geranomyces variabilis]KAJ3135658.1 hypothetical protein HDU90_003733 [Geranomyces variabilis]
MSVVSAKHAYKDADVRIVVGDTVFLVHKLLLSLTSDYFNACFSGPWTETAVKEDSNLREILLSDVDPDRFSLLLDWIYRTESFADPCKIFKLLDLADRFQVTPLLVYLEQVYPPALSWENIEEWLSLATFSRYRFKGLVDGAVSFLQTASAHAWIRVWYLADKHDLPTLRDTQYLTQHSRMNLEMDPFFRKLSVPLQRDLFAACMAQTINPTHSGFTLQMKLTQPYTAESIAGTW